MEEARRFLLRWCFYSSAVIRELTLRSAATFGNCHLLRLFYDEYVAYLVVRRLAKSTGSTAVAVVGEFGGLGVSSGVFN